MTNYLLFILQIFAVMWLKKTVNNSELENKDYISGANIIFP